MQETLPKRLLFLAAAAIVAVTMMYTQHLAGIIRAEEQRKVQLWAEAVKQRAELVTYTQKLFEELGSEERKKADRLGDAYRIIQTSPPGMDLTFISDFLFSNKSVPVLIYNDEGKVLYNVNVEPPPSNVSRQEYFDSLRINVMGKNPPIRFEEVGQTIYYAESLRLTELRKAMADLIESFISETVINSASVPVLLVDSTGTKIVKSQGFDLTLLGDSAALHRKLYDLAKTNLPIPIVLPQGGAHLVFYEESWVLTQLRFFPAVQLLLIAAFLLVAYLVFSSSRRAEQDRVWVGMAKETAHQLGTPLSSLMAWSGLLASRGVDPEALAEMDKDLFRLQTVAERFSKIGSKPDLTMQDPLAVVQETVEYMRPRIGKHVDLVFELGETQGQIKVIRPLLSWVLENLLRNAVDAMDGQGTLTVRAMWSGDEVHVEVEDTGKGMSKALQRKVFEPGFTTKSRGWGLGLSLAKRIVEEMHRGSIYVARSEPGQGTCFRIVFIP